MLPTGGGKSLCFQVPALSQDGLCLVISPLIALMKDQVENLRKKGITALSIYSGLTRKEVLNTLEVAGNSNCKFLYISPERLETRIFKEYLPSLGVSLIAVDEAHCISQWGYDFRPSYFKIASLREELPGIPVLALTASATPEVQNDICEKLLFTDYSVFRQSFERPNLSYSVFTASSKINKIIDIFSKVQGTGIVYCRSRKKTKEISNLLNMNSISADYYHAGLVQEERNSKQENWLQNKIRVIVCTNAFGMGIDKPEVRVVVHADIPEYVENYYQEAGRAGRDGKKSYAVLLYNEKEIRDLQKSVADRFPDPEEIKKIYGSLMNFLQIASGTGEGNYYEFDLTAFIKNFSLKTTPVISTLKTLEQEELLYFNEQVFLPSKMQVTADKESLHVFEKMHPTFEAILKTLLRTYEGIIDQEVNINEKVISNILKNSVQETENQLKQLKAHGMIRYMPQKEKPQVYFIQNRVKAEDLKINITNYNKRKLHAESRVKAMLDYVYTSSLCRSKVIGNYFGDSKMKSCGICDNCLNKKRKEISGAEFEQILSSIMEVINGKPLTLPDLLSRMKGFPKEKTKEVIHFLQSEERIEVSDTGVIGMKRARDKSI